MLLAQAIDWVGIIGAITGGVVLIIGAMRMLVTELKTAIVDTKIEITKQVMEAKAQAAVADATSTAKLGHIHYLTNSTLTAANTENRILKAALVALVAERSGAKGVAETAARQLIDMASAEETGAMAQAKKALGPDAPLMKPEPKPPQP